MVEAPAGHGSRLWPAIRLQAVGVDNPLRDRHLVLQPLDLPYTILLTKIVNAPPKIDYSLLKLSFFFVNFNANIRVFGSAWHDLFG